MENFLDLKGLQKFLTKCKELFQPKLDLSGNGDKFLANDGSFKTLSYLKRNVVKAIFNFSGADLDTNPSVVMSDIGDISATWSAKDGSNFYIKSNAFVNCNRTDVEIVYKESSNSGNKATLECVSISGDIANFTCSGEYIDMIYSIYVFIYKNDI